MLARREVMSGMSGSGPFGAEAQIFWLGQDWQASPEPALEDSGPGQCSVVEVVSMEERAGGG